MTLNQKICIALFTPVMMIIIMLATRMFYRIKRDQILYSFLATQVALVAWLYFGMLEKMSSDLSGLLFAVRFSLVPVMLTGPLWFIFTLFYTGKAPKETLKWISLVLLPSLLCIWPLFTDKYFPLVIVSKTIGGASKTQWGPLMTLSLVVSYSYVFISIIMLFSSYRKKVAHYGMKALLLLGMMTPISVSLLAFFDLIESPGFDLTPLTFALISMITSYYIFKYQLFDVVPLASYLFFATVDSPALILSMDQRVIKANQAFYDFYSPFGTLESFMGGEEIFSVINNHSRLPLPYEKLFDMTLGRRDVFSLTLENQEKELAFFEVRSLRIVDQRGKVQGILIKFTDTTEAKKAAILEERNRLSYDLHDHLGNSINVIHSSLEAARRLDQDNWGVELAYNKTKEAFVNLRRLLHNLKPMTLSDHGLVRSLELMALRYKSLDVDIQLELDGLIAASTGPLPEEDIFYMCQESISNALRHGRAKKIEIIIKLKEQDLHLMIIDDGNGQEEVHDGHGLTSIKRRAQLNKGTCLWRSLADQGFMVKVAIPLGGKHD